MDCIDLPDFVCWHLGVALLVVVRGWLLGQQLGHDGLGRGEENPAEGGEAKDQQHQQKTTSGIKQQLSH